MPDLIILTDESGPQAPAAQMAARFGAGQPYVRDSWAVSVNRITDDPGSGPGVLNGTGTNRVILAVTGWPVASRGRVVMALLHRLGRGDSLLVLGVSASSYTEGVEQVRLARGRGIRFSAATLLRGTFQLPPLQPVPRSEVEGALVVLPSSDRERRIEGLDAVLGLMRGADDALGEGFGVRTRLQGDAVWRWVDESPARGWMLGAALSRSDTPQGHALEDGRVEDLRSLGLLQRLVVKPEVLRVVVGKTLRVDLASLPGAVLDITACVRLKNGGMRSTQFFVPPAPQQEGFTPFVAEVEAWLTGRPSRLHGSDTPLLCGLQQT